MRVGIYVLEADMLLRGGISHRKDAVNFIFISVVQIR